MPKVSISWNALTVCLKFIFLGKFLQYAKSSRDVDSSNNTTSKLQQCLGFWILFIYLSSDELQSLLG